MHSCFPSPPPAPCRACTLPPSRPSPWWQTCQPVSGSRQAAKPQLAAPAGGEGIDAGAGGFCAPPGCTLVSCVRTGRVGIEVGGGLHRCPLRPRSLPQLHPAAQLRSARGIRLIDTEAWAVKTPAHAPQPLPNLNLSSAGPPHSDALLCWHGRPALQPDCRPRLGFRHRRNRARISRGPQPPATFKPCPSLCWRPHFQPGTA